MQAVPVVTLVKPTMLHTSYIELNKQALQENITFLKSLLPSAATRFSMVVKANAYGHGIEELLPMAEDYGIDHFSVFSVAEAMRVQKATCSISEIMILGFIDDDYLEWAIREEVSFYVFSMERLEATLAAAKKVGKAAKIHIELETGMHRTGFCDDQIHEMTEFVLANRENLHLEGVCTHYAGAEDFENHERIKNQIQTFRKLCTELARKGLTPTYRHTACSGALFNFPEAIMDMVRIGIASYGFWPNQETRQLFLQKNNLPHDPLKRILTWKSKVLSVNKVPANAYVSYGKSYQTTRPSRIATVPVGYGYGFSRNLSNNGRILVGGRQAPVVGFVNMNMVVIDVTDIPGVRVHDEAVLIGKQGDQTMTVSSFSDMNNSLNYELLTRLPDHIPKYPVQTKEEHPVTVAP
jgi:alanine racemase